MSDTIPVGILQQALADLGHSLSPLPVTIASAATIAPLTYLTIVTGTVQISTITIPFDGFQGTLAFVFTNGSPGATLTTGNIVVATTPVQYKTLFMTYNPNTLKWYPSYK